MKIKILKQKTVLTVTAVCMAVMAFSATSRAQDMFTISNSASSAFMASGPSGGPNLSTTNFGNAGTVAIAPASSPQGAFDSVLLFNTSAAVSQFNTLYGFGNWTITGVSLSLASNFGGQGEIPNNNIFNTINGGVFGIDWLVDNSWTVGNGGGSGVAGYPANNLIDYAYVPTLLSFGYDTLGNYTYTPPGDNLYQTYTLQADANLDNDAASGEVSLFFYAPTNSEVSYLFNTQKNSTNHPELILTATPTPEPGTLAMLATGLAGLLMVRRSARRS